MSREYVCLLRHGYFARIISDFFFTSAKKRERVDTRRFFRKRGNLFFSNRTVIYLPTFQRFHSLLLQRADLPGARTGGLPPIGGSPSRGARIFQKKKEKGNSPFGKKAGTDRFYFRIKGNLFFEKSNLEMRFRVIRKTEPSKTAI